MKLDKINARGASNFYRHPKSGIIYFRQYKKGSGEIYRSTRTTKLEDAKKAAEGFTSRGSKVVKDQVCKFALERFDKWIERKKGRNLSPATITSINASRKHLAPYLEMTFPDQLTSEWWESVYIPETSLKGFKKNGEPKILTTPRRFFNDRKWLKSFLLQLKEDGHLTQAPKFSLPDPDEMPGKAFSDEEVENLLNFSEGDLHDMLVLALTMGMRKGEIQRLHKTRVDQASGVINLKKEDTKIRRARSFAISPMALPIIARRMETASEWIFPSKVNLGSPIHKDGAKTAWSNLKKVCGVTGRFHDLRHTFLTKAFMAPDANAALICHYAGLSLEVAVKRYLHYNEKDSQFVAQLVSYGESRSGKIRGNGDLNV